jgi:hypothetical protein
MGRSIPCFLDKKLDALGEFLQKEDNLPGSTEAGRRKRKNSNTKK